MTTSGIGLADAIENLRLELIEATRRGKGQELRFTIYDIKLELAVEVVREGGAEGKVNFKVLGSGAKGGLSHSNAHRVTIALKPSADSGGTWSWRVGLMGLAVVQTCDCNIETFINFKRIALLS